MKTNWTRIGGGYYQNSSTTVEIYRGMGGWFAHNARTAQTSGPFRTMREAKLASYELVA